MIDYFKLFFAILYPTFIGFVFLSVFIPRKDVLSNMEKLALSFLIGSGGLSLVIFLLGACKIKLILVNILIGSAIILAPPLYLSLKNKTLTITASSWIKIKKFTWFELILLALIFIRVSFVLFENLSKPVISVDAFANWSLRAKAFFFDSGLLLNQKGAFFLGGGAVFYPLNIPLVETWIFNVLGYWNDELIKIIFGLFFLALITIFYSAIRRVSARPVALFSTYLLTTLPLLVHHATIEYADFPLSVYFTASALFLLNYFDSKNNKYLYLSAILAGIAAWTKTEGVPLLLINLVVLGIFYIRSKQELLAAAKNIFYYILVALIFKLPWSIFNWAYHIPKSIYQQIEYEKIFINLDRLPVILSYFYNKMFFYGHWNIAWFVFVVVLILSFNRLKEARFFYPFIYILLFLLAFGTMYYITENYVWLLDGTTLNRNTLLIMPLVIFFIAINLQDLLAPPPLSGQPKKKRKK
ncbi:glycosyltransferase family 39 protein [Candidatus Saganbacteria bacterium]|nr:glycosyltransferase family 39 protein [Candidatus Saganbacteria bacterium]